VSPKRGARLSEVDGHIGGFDVTAHHDVRRFRRELPRSLKILLCPPTKIASPLPQTPTLSSAAENGA